MSGGGAGKRENNFFIGTTKKGGGIALTTVEAGAGLGHNAKKIRPGW